MRNKQTLYLLALSLLVAAPALAVQSIAWNPGQTGLIVGDLVSPRLWTNGTWSAASGLTLAEDTTAGRYTIGGLPDTTTGAASTWYALAFEDPEGNDWLLSWRIDPDLTATSLAFSLLEGNVMGQGDTGIDIAAIFRGFSASPATGTATFSLWCDGSFVVEDAAATITGATQASDGTWYATFTYDTQVGDTATPGECPGRFKLTDSGGDVQSLPRDWSLVVRIVPSTP